MIARLIAFFLALAAARGAIESANDLPFAEDCVLRTWEVAEGLRDNHISGIARGDDGYLWVTNFSGLFRFDGARFAQVDGRILPGLPSPWVAPVFSARDGALWLGLERGGVARWSRGQLDNIVPIRPRPTPEIWPWSFAEENSGAVWFGAANESRASRFSDGKLTVFSAGDGLPAGGRTVVRVARDGTVWAATSAGCALFDGQRFQPVDPGAGDPGRLPLAPARAGGMWTIRDGKLLRYGASGERLETFSAPWLQALGQVNALHEDQAGALWIGTRDFGLLRLREGEFERIRTSFGDISCLTEDRDGNLWAGTWGGGLNRLSPRHLFLRQPWPDRPHEVPRSLCEDAEGRLWILGRDGDPARAADKRARSFAPVPGWPAGQRANVVCADPAGGVWFGTAGGLLRWRDGLWTPGPLHEPVAALLATRDGTLWIATEQGGVFRHRDGHLEALGEGREVRALARDSRGRLWTGDQHGGLFFQDNGARAPVALPEAGGDETVRFIVPDGPDTVWIGTLLGGLYRWKNGQARRVPAPADVSFAEVRSLLIEREGRAEAALPGQTSAQDVFWLGTATGLLRIARADLEGFLDGGRPVLNLMECGGNEGLPTTEFDLRAQNASVRTRDGRLWFATNRGLLEIQPGAASAEAPGAARVLIEEMGSGPSAHPPGGAAAVFPPRPDAIRIRYTLPELRMPERVRFRYRLGDEGGPGSWIDAGPQREATIVRPGPGRYRFEVTAAVGDGPWLPRPAVSEFTVRAAWWQTGAFRGGVVLASVAGVALLMRAIVTRRMRMRIRRLEQAQAIERERARIARDMHDELGASLTLLAAMARFAASEPDGDGRQLGEIEATAQQTVESLDEIVWAVNPRNDTLAGTVEYIGKCAAGFLAKAGIEAGIALPDGMPPHPISAEIRHQLFLAVKESLGNVVKHSGATQAKLEIRADAERLEIVVADNGRGIGPGAADRFADGLGNMSERMAGIGGSCRVESRPGAGCRVVFGLPLRDDAPAGDSA